MKPSVPGNRGLTSGRMLLGQRFLLSVLCCCGLLSVMSLVTVVSYGSSEREEIVCETGLAEVTQNGEEPHVLVAFRHAGGNWAQAMLERLTGYRTTLDECARVEDQADVPVGCVYPRLALVMRFEDSMRLRRVLQQSTTAARKMVILARNPFDVIVLKFAADESKLTGGRTLDVETIKEEVAIYKNVTRDWAKIAVPKLLFRFEELMRHPEQWGRAAFFLDVPITDDRLQCAIDSSDIESLPSKWESPDLGAFEGMTNFSETAKEYVKTELHSELCYLGYGGFSRLNITCESKFLHFAAKQEEANEERDRLRRDFTAERERQRATHSISAPNFWYDKLRILNSSHEKPAEGAVIHSYEGVPAGWGS
mmetsp:Transcript_6754/g.20467  ORF Transcript_6754/g.20467 Transcript_6754/m.20467 type:complete len:366 (+) Transcript_6754:133-1230(+)